MRIFIIKITFSIFLLAVQVVLPGCEKGESPAALPEAKFTFTSVASFPVSVSFNNTSTTPAGSTATYQWAFGDGNGATTNNATHNYILPGSYQVMLRQSLSSGAADTFFREIPLSANSGPSGVSNRQYGSMSANFDYSIISRAYKATFINTSENADTYLWNFGDGNTSTSNSDTVLHTFSTGGSYRVTLAASSNNNIDTSGVTIIF